MSEPVRGVRYRIVHEYIDEPGHAPLDHPGVAVSAGPGAAVHPNFVRLSATEGLSATKPTLRRQSALRHRADDDRGRHPGAPGVRLHRVDKLGASEHMSRSITSAT